MKVPNSPTQCDSENSWINETLEPIKCLHAPVWVYDVDAAQILWCNNNALAVWHSESQEELLSRQMSGNMSLSVAKRLEQYKVDFSNDPSTIFREIWTLYPNGEPTTFDLVFSPFQLNTGRMCMFCEIVDQVSTGHDALRSAEALLHTSVNISLYAASGEPLYRNPAARSNVISYSKTLSEHFDNGQLLQQLQNTDNEEVKAVTSVNTVHGKKWHDITARRCTDAVSGEPAWLISEVDVSRLKATEERAQFVAEHDTLTQLPNRNYVSIYFQSRIDKLLSTQQLGALLFIDLDNFKDVNDSLGHDAGDQLLVEVSNRLKRLSTADNSVARLGGDEFIVLVEFPTSEFAIETFAEEIIQLVSRPVIIQGREIQVTPSIGIAKFPSNGKNIRELMRHADLAMYHAKDVGKNNFVNFSEHLSAAVENRISLESDIKRGLKNDEFEAYFQPRIDINTGAIVSAEALVRWHHPERGMVYPGYFIPTCEESGLIAELGKLIFTKSIAAQRSWSEQGYDLRVSVNLSPLQFAEQDLVSELIKISNEQNGNPNRIELEITESVLLGNDEETIEKLHKLVDHGFKISIDDFGTGYSSLAYLHRYPISCLKIDKSFIESLDSAKPIVELIISMAKLFDLYVVAEGVESSEQLEVLRSYECHEYQGFLFSKAIDFESFTQLIVGSEQQAA